MRGKIIKGIAGFYYVHDGARQIYECKARGIFRNRGKKPLVGDDVEFTVLSEEEKTGSIVELLPRENELQRPAVANAGQALVMFAVREPDPSFPLLDRFLILLEEQACSVSILFTKSDLAEEEERRQIEKIYRGSGYPIRFVSTVTGEGMEELRDYLRGRTTVLSGPSGVGKTSLLNTLVRDAQMETGELSRKGRRGRQTTRHSEIFYVEPETYLVDTPGFSSLFIENMDPEHIRECFPEFMPYWNQCRFHGCKHQNEPDCRVKQAVREGEISAERYRSYLQLYEECRSQKRY